MWQKIDLIYNFRIKHPELQRHIESLHLSWAVIATKWFVCLFAEVLPVEVSKQNFEAICIINQSDIICLQTVFRIWDCLFYEGSKILFRVGLTLVTLNYETLLKCDDLASLIMCFKAITHDALVTDCHSFMQVITKWNCSKIKSFTWNFSPQSIFKVPGSLKNSTIARLRQECADKAAAARKKWILLSSLLDLHLSSTHRNH